MQQRPRLPAWIASRPLFQWVDVPNSRRAPSIGKGLGLDPGYLRLIGFPVPTQREPDIVWPPNKHGQSCVNPAWQPTSWFKSSDAWAGSAVDDGAISGRVANLMLGAGDAHWADNSVYRFYFGADSPHWDVAVLGTHASEIKNGRPRTAGRPCSVADDSRCDKFDFEKYPNDRPEHWRHYDGTIRGGHDYWVQWYCAPRNWYVHFGQHQFWPVDSGRCQVTFAADLGARDATGYSRWMTNDPTPPWNMWRPGVETPWGRGDYGTGDYYKLLGTRLVRWKQAANVWEECWRWGGTSMGWDQAIGAINYTHGYVLLCSIYGGTDVTGIPRSVVWWKVPLSAIPMGTVSASTFRANQLLATTGTHAAMFTSPPRLNGRALEWLPEAGFFILHIDDGRMYNVKPNGPDPTSLAIEEIPMTTAPGSSAPPPRFQGDNGVWTKFLHVPALKMCILRQRDNAREGMKAFRTG